MSRNRLYTRTFGSTRASNSGCTETPDPCASVNIPGPRCITCVTNRIAENEDCPTEARRRHVFKQMFNTVRVSSSEYSMNRAALHVGNDTATRTAQGNNQSSDRAVASVVNPTIHANPALHGNSRTSSKTRLRPGSLTPGGTGVDIKHNSYARYLARIKGSGLLKEETTCQTGSDSNFALRRINKVKKYNIVALPASCRCP